MADRVLLLHEGQIKDLGEPLAVVEQYKNFGIYQDGEVVVKEYGTREITIDQVAFESGGKTVTEEMEGGRDLVISFRLRSGTTVENAVIGFAISDNMGNTMFGTNTQIMGMPIPVIRDERNVRIVIPALNLQRGVYFFSLAVHSQDHKIQYHRLDNTHKIRIIQNNQSEGILFLPCQFDWND